jgi:hypothetical protein
MGFFAKLFGLEQAEDEVADEGRDTLIELDDQSGTPTAVGQLAAEPSVVIDMAADGPTSERPAPRVNGGGGGGGGGLGVGLSGNAFRGSPLTQTLIGHVVAPVGPAPTRDRRGRSWAPAQRPDAGGPSDVLTDVIDGLDDAFDAVFAEDASRVVTAEGRLISDADTNEHLFKLFAEIAAEYVGQVRDFMLELSVGPTTKEWIEIIRPAIASIKQAAATMQRPDLGAGIEEFESALELVLESSAGRIEGPARDMLISRYERLIALLPQAFKLADERGRREPIIVHSLLQQVPGVHKVTIDKVYAAGVTTLAGLCHATASDLAQTTGIDHKLAAAIVAKFHGYWESRTQTAPEEAQMAAIGRLSRVIRTLEAKQEAFRAAESTDDIEKKRQIRGERNALLLDVNVILAQAGEVGLVKELERLAVDRKIARLSEYLNEALGG